MLIYESGEDEKCKTRPALLLLFQFLGGPTPNCGPTSYPMICPERCFGPLRFPDLAEGQAIQPDHPHITTAAFY